MGELRPERIDAQHLFPVSTLSLPPEAVYTTKIKLVAQPRFVRLIRAVATRTVTTDMLAARIREGHRLLLNRMPRRQGVSPDNIAVGYRQAAAHQSVPPVDQPCPGAAATRPPRLHSSPRQTASASGRSVADCRSARWYHPRGPHSSGLRTSRCGPRLWGTRSARCAWHQETYRSDFMPPVAIYTFQATSGRTERLSIEVRFPSWSQDNQVKAALDAQLL